MRLIAAFTLITLGPGYAFAQRGGRPDSAQNHYGHPNPTLNVEYQSTETWSYFYLSDLLKMKRVAVSVYDPKTKQKNVYEGVPLDELAPNLSSYRVEVFRDFWAFKDKQDAQT